MSRAKKAKDEAFVSISDFFMVDYKCQRSFNGYYQWKCSKRSCKFCKDAMPAKLKCPSSDDIVTVDQFEVVTREYLKYNKKTKEVETKTTKLTDRVSYQMTYRKPYKNLVSTKKMYKYHVYNDKHHWPIILLTTAKYGKITHSDYSVNMSQMHQQKAQSCHFNKTSYFLHCTVEHINRKKHQSILPPYCCLHHFSDDTKHDYAFTNTVALSCLALNDLPQTIRQESDNFGYKSRYVW